MVSVETLGVLERRLHASISQQQLRGEVEARLKRLGHTARIHGFRPGKVPFKILEQQYGAQVHQEVLGDALQRSFADTAQANSLRVVGSPDFEVKTDDPAASEIEYSATFEIYPEIVLGDMSAENVERATYTLSDADVDNTIATLRKQRATYEACQRAAQNEDRVRIDFSGKLDGASFEGGDAGNVTVVLGAGRMLADFENAIIGMSAGETKTFDMTFPADYHGKPVAGKKVAFTITLHAVEAPRLPQLDAEFVRSLGIKDGDINSLKVEIRNNLAQEAERRLKLRNKENAMSALLKTSTLEVPKALLDWEARNIMQQTVQELKGSGVQMPQDLNLSPGLFAERAQKRVKLGLVVAELVKRHHLEAKPEQVRALVQEYARTFDRPEEVVKWHYADAERMQAAENLVLEDNVVNWVFSVARVTDKAVEFSDLMRKD